MPETNRRLFKKLEYKGLPVNNEQNNLYLASINLAGSASIILAG